MSNLLYIQTLVQKYFYNRCCYFHTYHHVLLYIHHHGYNFWKATSLKSHETISGSVQCMHSKQRRKPYVVTRFKVVIIKETVVWDFRELVWRGTLSDFHVVFVNCFPLVTECPSNWNSGEKTWWEILSAKVTQLEEKNNIL